MIKNYLIFILLTTITTIIISCKSTYYSYSSVQDHQVHGSEPLKLKPSEVDCFAWKVNLTITLHNAIESHARLQRSDELIKKRQEQSRRIQTEGDDFDIDSSLFQAPPRLNIEKIFPAQNFAYIVNKIIEREGGACSKELLYSAPCTIKLKDRMGRETPRNAVPMPGDIDWDYFSTATGVPLSSRKTKQLNEILNNHIDIKMNTSSEIHSYEFYCDSFEECSYSTRYYLRNNFGFCMLKKHEKFLRDENLINLRKYIRVEPRSLYYIVDYIYQDKYEEFVKRSEELKQLHIQAETTK